MMSSVSSSHYLIHQVPSRNDIPVSARQPGSASAEAGHASDPIDIRRETDSSAGVVVNIQRPGDSGNLPDGRETDDAAGKGSESLSDTVSDQASADGADESSEKSRDDQSVKTSGEELTEAEAQEVDKLAQRDQEVRTHEQAHIAAGGVYVRGGAHYELERGPDGKNYAIGGEVSIDTSPVSGDPDATIQKMQIIRNAALAPADPSATDHAVAAEAGRVASAARAEKMAEQLMAVDEDMQLPAVRRMGPSETESYARLQFEPDKGSLVDIAV